jgi:LysR family transcriptional regulator, cyn operon transcriptional activator
VTINFSEAVPVARPNFSLPRDDDATCEALDLSNSFMVCFDMTFRNSPKIKLGQLRTFIAVAENGGFARAAGRLHLTQSAASRQIMALESDLGLRLFARNGQQTTLTIEGEDLLRRSRRLLADADSLAERAHALKGGQTGILRVSASPQVLENILAPFLPRYGRAHPGVEVQLSESGAARLGQLERGEIHLAIMPALEAQRFRWRLLYPIHVLAAVAKAHRFARCAVLDLAEITDEPLLLLKQGFVARAWFEAACNASGIQPRVLVESGAVATLAALAAVGHGVAIIPSNVILQKAVRCVMLTAGGLPIGRWSSIVWNQHRFLPQYAEDFVEELVANVRRSYPGRELVRRAPQLPRPSEA